MLLLLAHLAFATHVTTFAVDPAYTQAPFSGLESLVVDPAQVAPTLSPWTGAVPPDAMAVANGAEPPDRTLTFTNPTSTWAHLSINGTLIGIIGPYATARFEGLKPGQWWISLKLNNGHQREFLVRTAPTRVRTAVPVKVDLLEDRIQLSDRIHFELDSAVIEADSHPLLDALAKLLVEHPEVTKVSVEGHTDQQGSGAYNQKLSEDRAAAVVAYLTKAGVAPERLASAGFGESRLVDPANTEDAYEKNRRVELRVVGRQAPVELPPPAPPVKGGRKK